MRTHATVAVLSGHKSQVSTIAFSPDGRTLVTGGLDHDVKLWNFEKRTQVTTLKGHTAPILSIAFSPDGKTMVSTDGNHKVLVWRGGPSDAVAESTSTPPN
jgi:WD40 repeat protein